MTESHTCVIVEWDIPANPPNPHRRFYYHLKRLWVAYEGEKEMSTRSVLITDNEEFAQEVWNLARAYGKAHMYRAWPIK